VFLVLPATLAISASVRRSQGLPRRVRPLRRRPPLSVLPGHIPAQEARCSAEGKRERSVPLLSDERFGGSLRHAGDGLQECDGFLIRGETRGELGVHPRDGRVQVVQMGELFTRTGKTWCCCSRPTTAWARASRLARSRPRASSANACASVSLSSKRWRISRAPEATHVGDDRGELGGGVILASSSTACKPLDEPRPLVNEVDAIAGEAAQMALRRRRKEAGRKPEGSWRAPARGATGPRATPHP
jgi:hypothetical protein